MSLVLAGFYAFLWSCAFGASTSDLQTFLYSRCNTSGTSVNHDLQLWEAWHNHSSRALPSVHHACMRDILSWPALGQWQSSGDVAVAHQERQCRKAHNELLS
jgi:hypothetical protein